MSLFNRLGKTIISSFSFKKKEIKVAWIIILVWLIIIMPITAYFSSRVMESMSTEWSLVPPGSDSDVALKILEDEYPPSNESLIAVLKSETGFEFDANLFNTTYQASNKTTDDLMAATIAASNDNFLYGMFLSLHINESVYKRGIGQFEQIMSPFVIFPGLIMSFPNQSQIWMDFWDQMFFANDTITIIIVDLDISSSGFSELGFGEQGEFFDYIEELRYYVRKGLSRQLTLAGLALGISVSPNTDTKITGSLAISYDSLRSAQEDRERMDILTIVLVIIILFIVLRSLVAPMVPLLTMAPALLLANTMLYFLGNYIVIGSFAPVMVTVLGLGVGVDYSIFILTRFLDELREGKTKEEAIMTSVTMSGRAILSSGLVVITGFGALLIPNLELIQSIGLGVIIAITCGLLSAFTLLPSLLYVFGWRVIWPRKITLTAVQGEEEQDTQDRRKMDRKFWRRLVRFSIRFAWPIIIFALIITAPFLMLLASYQPSYDILSMLPPNVESSEAFEILDEIGMTSELYGNSMVLSGFANSDELWANSTLFAIEELAKWLVSTEAIQDVETITRPSLGLVTLNLVDLVSEAQGTETPFLTITSLRAVLPPSNEFDDIAQQYVNWNQANNTVILKLIFVDNPMGPEAMGDLRYLRAELKDFIKFGFPTNVKGYIYGGTSVNVDMSNELYSAFPLMVLWIIITIMIILTLLLGSITVPIRLIITIATSVTWTLGFLVLMFQFNLEEISLALLNPNINVEAGLYWIIPPILFCILFALGMDYDIFITSRIREEFLRGRSNHEAIEEGLIHTASVVTTCALIMAGAFLALWFSFILILTEIGLGMVFAVIVDATIVRVFLVPAAMAIMGDKYNWWPEWVHKRFGKFTH
ncbi:MAG: MMPL family transporter [Candidatus Hodarchaeota archaeon]